MIAKKARVSLCMIVRNEEQNLAECLEPVAGLFDEIIIVDTGSHDKTKEIAKRFKSHVHDFAWCDDFSAARNESLKHATGDWIFWLDADDRMRPAQVATLRQILNQLDDRQQIFIFKTVLPPSTLGADRLFVSHPRLFRHHRNLQWHGRVHEQLGPEAVVQQFDRIPVDVEIEHIGYLDSIFANRKARLKLRLLRMDYAVNPHDISTLLHLGTALHAIGNHREALRMLLPLFDRNQGNVACLQPVYDLLIELSYLTGNRDDVARFVELGLADFPDDEHFLLVRAKIYYLNRDFPAAIQTLRYLLRQAESRNLHYRTPTNIKTRLAPLLLAAAYRLQREYPSAEQTLHAILDLCPNDCEALFNLGMVYLDQACWPKFQSLLCRLATTSGGYTGAAVLTAKMLLRHGELNSAAQLIDQIIDKEPRFPRARMLRTEYLSLAQKPLEDQIRAHRDLLRTHPDNLDARDWLQNALLKRQDSTRPSFAPAISAASQEAFQVGPLAIAPGFVMSMAPAAIV